ncbi:MAG: FAD binding domain-containing protein [Steroidobacter sp.]
METFEWIDASSVEDAVRLLSAGSSSHPVVAKAGGMDLLDLMKEGVVRPARVVNLRSIAELDVLRMDERSLHLGALVTLSRIAQDLQLQQHYNALTAAAAHAATPQVRNVATIGGNLLQRTRSWYFRNEHLHDRRVSSAADSENQYDAIFDNAQTAMVHASTPATALLAYHATVHLTGPRGKRSVPLDDLFLAPDAARASDAAIARDEVLTHVSVPAPRPNTRAAYHKQTERDSYDWPICDVAVVLEMEGDVVASASIVLGWVAPTPRRAGASERALIGRRIDAASATEAARAAVRGATPLSKNGYKVQVLEAVVRRTILAAR